MRVEPQIPVTITSEPTSRNGRRFRGRTGHIFIDRPDERVCLVTFADVVGAMSVEFGYDEITREEQS